MKATAAKGDLTMPQDEADLHKNATPARFTVLAVLTEVAAISLSCTFDSRKCL